MNIVKNIFFIFLYSLVTIYILFILASSFLLGNRESKIIKVAPIKMQLSATLNAGQ